MPVLVPRHRLGLGLAERGEGKGQGEKGGSPDTTNWLEGGDRENDGKYDKVE
jgi:hypothetical protein